MPLELATEYPPSGEDAAIAEIVAIMRRKLEGAYPPGVRPMGRAVHTKHHGCVRATFRVHDVPVDLRHGLFAQPATYAALIRFSNSMGEIRADGRRDLRGLAIKLFLDSREADGSDVDPTGATQDFLLASSPVFFLRDVAEFVELLRRDEAGSFLRFFFGPDPRRWRLRQFRMMQRSLRRVRNPLDARYWSQTPYRLGPHAVKYSLTPTGRPGTPRPRASGPDALRLALRHTLDRDDASFDFLVQRQTDPVRTPIEDATIEWPERESAFRPVATVTVPRQWFESETQMNLAENLSFSPWQTLPEHRPMGGLNRARRVVYETLSGVRHRANHIPVSQPRGDS